MSSGKQKLYHNQKAWQGCCVSHVSDAWQKDANEDISVLLFLNLWFWPPQLSSIEGSSHHRVGRKSSVGEGFTVGLGLGGELSLLVMALSLCVSLVALLTLD